MNSTDMSRNCSFVLYVPGTQPDTPDGCKVIGRNLSMKTQEPHRNLLNWNDILFCLILVDMQNIYPGGFSCIILFSHSYNIIWSCYCRTTHLKFMSWSSLLHVQYFSLLMAQDASDVLRISWFAFLVTIIEIFSLLEWNLRKIHMLSEPKAKLGYFIVFFKTEGSHLFGAQLLIIVNEL